MENNLPNRKQIRLETWDYSNPWWYFVTICTHNMVHRFGTVINETMTFNAEGEIVNKEWQNTEKMRDNVKLDIFQVMPNHMHMVFEILDNPSCRGTLHVPDTKNTDVRSTPLQRQPNSASSIIAGFKSSVTKQIRMQTNNATLTVWQRGFYDRVIRNDRELDRIKTYIVNNPKNWLDDEYFL